MADRIIRDEMLESERWLGLRDNTARVCYITLILKADALGNLEAHVPRLVRMWRDYGVSTRDGVNSTLEELVNVDLIRLYEAEVDGITQQFIHIPRYRQNLRYVKRIYPLSPWTTDKQKQTLKINSQGEHDAIAGRALGAHVERTVEVKRSDVEVKRKDVDVEVTKPVEGVAPKKKKPKLQNLLDKIQNQHPEGFPKGSDIPT